MSVPDQIHELDVSHRVSAKISPVKPPVKPPVMDDSRHAIRRL